MAAHCGPILIFPAMTSVSQGEPMAWSYAPGELSISCNARIVVKFPISTDDLRRMLEYAEAAESEGAK